FAQGAGCLDTRGSAPDDDEVERATLDASRIRTDPLELADDMIAQRNRVVEALQLQRVLGDAGYAERVRGRPGGEDEEVERDASAIRQQHVVRLPVNPGHGPEAEAEVRVFS